MLSSFYRGISVPILVRLLAAPFLLSLVDLAVTLNYQPAAYWEGDRSVVVEGNPIARLAFFIHPLMIIPGFLGWYAIVIPLILKSPARIGLRIHVFLILGHLIMISGWLIRNGEDGLIWAAIVWIIFLPLSWVLFSPFKKFWNADHSVC